MTAETDVFEIDMSQQQLEELAYHYGDWPNWLLFILLSTLLLKATGFLSFVSKEVIAAMMGVGMSLYLCGMFLPYSLLLYTLVFMIILSVTFFLLQLSSSSPSSSTSSSSSSSSLLLFFYCVFFSLLPVTLCSIPLAFPSSTLSSQNSSQAKASFINKAVPTLLNRTVLPNASTYTFSRLPGLSCSTQIFPLIFGLILSKQPHISSTSYLPKPPSIALPISFFTNATQNTIIFAYSDAPVTRYFPLPPAISFNHVQLNVYS